MREIEKRLIPDHTEGSQLLDPHHYEELVRLMEGSAVIVMKSSTTNKMNPHP
jgi:hypothetical protein